jgi:hypothetical protein
MGYLVARQHSAPAMAGELIAMFENIARESTGPSSQVRRDALYGMLRLRREENYAVHPDARAKLLQLIKDPTFRVGKLDALYVLASTARGLVDQPEVVETLISGVVEYGGPVLASGVKEIRYAWETKVQVLISALQNSSRAWNQLDMNAILQALSTPDESPTHRLDVEAVLIESARDPKNQDIRMSRILAGLLVACEAGDSEQAGNRLNAYQRDHNIPEQEVRNLRLQIGGPAVASILRQNVTDYFLKPIEKMNTQTGEAWKGALTTAKLGFNVRLLMSIVIFLVGLGLLIASSIKMLGTKSDLLQAIGPFTAGLGTMLLIVYAGPLKDVRQSVSDVATANAVFIAYIHRVLEISQTFASYCVKEEMTFEEMVKSSNLIKEAMDNTVRSLNMTATDSSEDVILRAMAFAAEKLKNDSGGHR